MGRSFVQATPSYIEGSTVPVASQPFTAGVWFKANNATARHTVWSMIDASATSNYFELRVRGDDAQQLQFRANATGGENASTSNTFAQDKWYLAVGRAVGDAERDAYLLRPESVGTDFAAGGSNTNSKIPTGLDTIAVGRRALVSGNELDGFLGESFVYNVALPDWAILALGLGYSPWDPFLAEFWGNLPWYKDLNTGIEYPGIGGTWTDTSTAEAQDHPPMLRGITQLGIPAGEAGASPQTITQGTPVGLDLDTPAGSIAGSGSATLTQGTALGLDLDTPVGVIATSAQTLSQGTPIGLDLDTPAGSIAGSGSATLTQAAVPSLALSLPGDSLLGSGSATVTQGTPVSLELDTPTGTINVTLFLTQGTPLSLELDTPAGSIAGTGSASLTQATPVSITIDTPAGSVDGSGNATLTQAVAVALEMAFPGHTIAGSGSVSITQAAAVALETALTAGSISNVAVGSPASVMPLRVQLDSSGKVRISLDGSSKTRLDIS